MLTTAPLFCHMLKQKSQTPELLAKSISKQLCNAFAIWCCNMIGSQGKINHSSLIRQWIAAEPCGYQQGERKKEKKESVIIIYCVLNSGTTLCIHMWEELLIKAWMLTSCKWWMQQVGRGQQWQTARQITPNCTQSNQKQSTSWQVVNRIRFQLMKSTFTRYGSFC